MSRVKRGNVARKRRKKILKLAKGYRGSLSKLFRQAKQTVTKGLANAFKDRRRKKREFRVLWIARMNAALRQLDMTYSVFINKAKQKNVELNRKVLAELAVSKPEVFQQVVEFVR
jgi:large subunit ribosomal protein L20